MSEALGAPFMPHQRYIADVSHEVDPLTGLLAYRTVIVVIPRQSGKTTLGLAVRVHRANGPFGGPQMLLYTAQTRNDARQKWEDEHLPLLKASPFGPLVRARKRTGAEAFLWRNGSIDGLPAPTEKAGHGKTLDLGFIDEAFAQVDDRLEQAFEPAMLVPAQPQLWVVSTAGTAASKYLRSKVQAGRRLIESGEPSRVAYFEWSAPNDADPMDPATWWACMPALGHTISEDAIRASLEKELLEHGADGLRRFRRSSLNQWPDEFPSGWHVLTEPAWRTRGGARQRPEGSVAFAVAAAYPDAESAAIAVAGRLGDEMVVQVVEHRPGTSWVTQRLVELVDRHAPVAVLLDKAGPAGRMVADVEAAGVELKHPSQNQVTQAAGALYASVAGDAPSLRHFGQKPLDDAVAAAQKRDLADAWTWARRGSTDISPLEAVSLAAWGATAFDRHSVAPMGGEPAGARSATADLGRMGF